MSAESHLLEVSDLSMSIPTDAGLLSAVRGVDFHVDRGEALCIVGESGCGKSLASLAVMGVMPRLARCKAAHIRFDGQDLAAQSKHDGRHVRGDRIAMIFQEPMTALNPTYTVGEQLVEGLLYHDRSTDAKAARARAIELLTICGVADARRRLQQYPHQLSGGLRQRVMIAMALMTRPDLLVADEPTTALDVTIQAQILDLLARLQRELPLSIILVTHDFDVVRRIGDRVIVMYAGEVVESGPVERVLASPLHPYTRALLACIPASTSAGRGARLGYLRGTVPSLVGEPVGCQFRDRCDLAHEACSRPVPRRATDGTHDYLCWLTPTQLGATSPARPQPASPGVTTAAASTTAAIELVRLEKTYPVSNGLFRRSGSLSALRGVDLAVRSGEVLGIVGESGSGKSTLARLVLGLEAPSAGEVRLKGSPVSSYGRAERARLVQPVFQDPYSSLNPLRSISAIIRMPLDIHGIGSPAERKASVEWIMGRCGLPPRLALAHPSQLSGGQRQRVAVASALVIKPDVVVCDEPTSALDVSVQAQILNLLQDLREEFGLTYVVISHDLNVIRGIADRVAVMYFGAVVEEGPADDLFSSPLHPYTQELLAATRKGRPPRASEAPNPLAPPSGCSFHQQCPRAAPVCRTVAPPTRTIGARSAACHFAGELPADRAL